MRQQCNVASAAITAAAAATNALPRGSVGNQRMYEQLRHSECVISDETTVHASRHTVGADCDQQTRFNSTDNSSSNEHKEWSESQLQ